MFLRLLGERKLVNPGKIEERRKENFENPVWKIESIPLAQYVIPRSIQGKEAVLIEYFSETGVVSHYKLDEQKGE